VELGAERKDSSLVVRAAQVGERLRSVSAPGRSVRGGAAAGPISARLTGIIGYR
jgi:hypothetical protein